MKKIKLQGKLSLNKETVSKLNDSEMKKINGGIMTKVTAFNCASAWCLPTWINCNEIWD
jgi:hypothetical protein